MIIKLEVSVAELHLITTALFNDAETCIRHAQAEERDGRQRDTYWADETARSRLLALRLSRVNSNVDSSAINTRLGEYKQSYKPSASGRKPRELRKPIHVSGALRGSS